MLEFIIGFVLGGVSMFLIVGVSLIVKDEKQIKQLRKHRLRREKEE